MKLFLYYALHSFKNQIKKLFRTWVAAFLAICFVLCYNGKEEMGGGKYRPIFLLLKSPV